MITWYIEPIELHLDKIKELFAKNADHKLASNYLETPLFEHTKFARMGYHNNKMIYYSAAMVRPQYNGTIRIMSRHTRDRNFNFGSSTDDLNRGLETLELSVDYAKSAGYTNIWVSRESSPKLFEYFARRSKYNWTVTRELMHYGEYQYIMRLN
tara:strand:- start:538 stop:999 length:462 start_codon:yes stop_codon:yes gene_type:complete